MILNNKFKSSLDPLLGCELPRIIVCLSADELNKSIHINQQNQFIAHCQKYLLDQYKGCVINVLVTSPQDLDVQPKSIYLNSNISKIDIYNTFNITNKQYYTPSQIAIEMNQAIKTFQYNGINDNNPLDLLNQTLSKMLVISNLVNEICENLYFNDGQFLKCLDHKGDPIVISSTVYEGSLEIGYALFDCNLKVICIFKNNIATQDIESFFQSLSDFQENVDTYYSKFLTNKVLSFLNGRSSFSECKDIDYAKDVCNELLIEAKNSLIQFIPEDAFCSKYNLDKVIEFYFRISINYAFVKFNNGLQDYCRIGN
ncbi:hypothetical protein [Acinetobacter sp. Marseille-Q1618]|uniref:hypothetical protein n=1 Tax=Acinetobacter sp. Marseille-Q1618 TaxID=2697502 RepID=UPI001570D105|nr:hypothetical protein [Acinetobacter sp. Marseille-Q1618]